MKKYVFTAALCAVVLAPGAAAAEVWSFGAPLAYASAEKAEPAAPGGCFAAVIDWTEGGAECGEKWQKYFAQKIANDKAAGKGGAALQAARAVCVPYNFQPLLTAENQNVYINYAGSDCAAAQLKKIRLPKKYIAELAAIAGKNMPDSAAEAKSAAGILADMRADARAAAQKAKAARRQPAADKK